MPAAHAGRGGVAGGHWAGGSARWDPACSVCPGALIFHAKKEMAQPLNQMELLSLVAMLRLGEHAYGVTIHEEIERSVGRSVSMAGVYSALDRLEHRGLARIWHSEPRAERGGRSRRHYELTAAGREMVRREREQALRMWRGLAPDLDGRK